jgi:hypothetical protein
MSKKTTAKLSAKGIEQNKKSKDTNIKGNANSKGNEQNASKSSSNLRKIFAVLLVVALIVNLVLYGIGRSNDLILWAVIVVIAIIAFWVLPKIKR